MQTFVLLGHEVSPAPLGQVREQPAPSQRQVAAFVQVIVQAPVHWAVQSAALLQVIVVPAPTFNSQSEALLQEKSALPGAVRSHFALSLHATLAPSATEPLQAEVVPHSRSEPGAATTLHVPPEQPHFLPVQEQPPPSQVDVTGTGLPQAENIKARVSKVARMRPV